jgi:DNA-binding response OmpR family regulator
VDIAADGNTAAQLGLVHPYDVIILDVMLPGQDGLAVASQLRAAGSPRPS